MSALFQHVPGGKTVDDAASNAGRNLTANYYINPSNPAVGRSVGRSIGLPADLRGCRLPTGNSVPSCLLDSDEHASTSTVSPHRGRTGGCNEVCTDRDKTDLGFNEVVYREPERDRPRVQLSDICRNYYLSATCRGRMAKTVLLKMFTLILCMKRIYSFNNSYLFLYLGVLKSTWDVN